MITDSCLGLGLLAIIWFLKRETKSGKFLDRQNAPVYQEGEEEDRDS